MAVGKIGEGVRISSSALDAMLKRCGSIAHHENHVDRRFWWLDYLVWIIIRSGAL